MPLERLMLILVIVLAAAGATIWIAYVVMIGAGFSPMAGLALGVPTALFAYIAWRVIAERVTDREDKHYDGIDK